MFAIILGFIFIAFAFLNMFTSKINARIGRNVIPIEAFGTAAQHVKSRIVLFDGDCVMCNTSAQFVFNRNDPKAPVTAPHVIRYAALQSKIGVAVMDRCEHLKGVDSVMFLQPINGGHQVEVLSKSRAALAVMKQCGTVWNVVGTVATLVPPTISDTVYDFVARNRHRWFGRRTDGDPGCQRPPRGFKPRVLKDGDIE